MTDLQKRDCTACGGAEYSMEGGDCPVCRGAGQIKTTRAANWRKPDDHVDPHHRLSEMERAQLTMGDLTDDELANGMFMYDHRNGLGSMSWLTAGKERIRWLSRKLEETLALLQPQDIRTLLGMNTLKDFSLKQVHDALQEVHDKRQKSLKEAAILRSALRDLIEAFPGDDVTGALDRARTALKETNK